MEDVALSREISYALRHAPWQYELELDDEGWVEVDQLLAALRETGNWPKVSQQDLANVIARAEKKRFEIEGSRIRALYGHSLPQKIMKEPAAPPGVLYHGTARRFLPSILAEGLLPQSRQYVHLSADIKTAIQVGWRRDGRPTLLSVRAAEAHRDGVAFYRGNDMVWLADKVPVRYIDQVQRD